MCGKLFCHDGQGNPNYGRMVRFGACKASFFDDHTKDYGQVDVGTKCGDGKVRARARVCACTELDLTSVLCSFKVCSQNECVDLSTAYRNTNCSAKCSGHAVSPRQFGPVELVGPTVPNAT